MSVMRVPFKMLAAPAPPFRLSREQTVLLLMDFQNYTTIRTAGFGKMAADRGIDREFDEYFLQVEAAIMNSQRLLQECRHRKIPVIHTLLACITPDRQDLSRQFRVNQFEIPCSDPLMEIRPEVAPQPGEIIIPRAAYSPFSSTAIHLILKQMAVENIILAGTMADTTIAMTAREAADRDFGVIVVMDSSASQTHDWHAQLRDCIVGGLIRQRTTTHVIEMMRGERT